MPKAKPKNASRYWCFTINNPTDSDDQQLCDLMSDDIFGYLCYGREKGENETPHYQAYLELLKPQRFSWVKKRISRAHIEPRRGSRTQARKYCFKEDPNPVEFGDWIPDRQGQRNDLIVVQRRLQDPEDTMESITDDHFESFCRYNRFFDKYRSMKAPKRNEPTKVIVHWGPTDTGKTRTAYEKYGGHFMEYTAPFFSDPQGHDVLIFDDIKNPIKWFGRTLFLRMTDRYPMKIRCLGKYVEWAPKIIIFTTNDNPEEWKLDPACRRRINEIVEFSPHIPVESERSDDQIMFDSEF